MNKVFGSILGAMAIVAVIYLNYHAVKDSVPFLRRQRDRVTNSKPFIKVSNWFKGTKTKAQDVSGRLVHMFKRKENVA